MLYNFTFLLSSLFFFFLKIWSEIGIRIIHGPALYTGKYGISNLKYCKGFLILVLGKGMEIYYFKPINAKNYNKQVDYFLSLLAISSNYSSFVMWL